MFEEEKVKSASVHVPGSLKVKEEKDADGNYFYRCGQTRTQSLLCICAVIYGKDLLSSRCIKGRTDIEREATSFFLPPSQAPFRASNEINK